MDSRIGLDYIVENRDYIAKLGSALDTQNATVKKQVFELLSALCAYSPDGYARAIETLEFYKVNTPAITTTMTMPFILFIFQYLSRISKRSVIASKLSSTSWNSQLQLQLHLWTTWQLCWPSSTASSSRSQSCRNAFAYATSL